jgi:hypothetical protein
MVPRIRSTITYLTIVTIVFAGALVASFVYTHEPQRDTLGVTISDVPAQPSDERAVGGTIASIDAASLQLSTEAGDVTVLLPAGVPVVDLVRVSTGDEAGGESIEAPFAPGTPVNVGGEQTQTGLIVSGIVAVEGATP